MVPSTDTKTDNRSNGRRSFLAIAIGLVVGVVPLVSGLVLFLSPLRRKVSAAKLTRIATLDAVPDDGLPHRFVVIEQREDAWSRYPAEPIGAVYVVRQPGSRELTAFTATCPHAGCFVGYSPGDDKFVCPCHTSAFRFDGTRIGGDQSVSPRDMDMIDVEVVAQQREDGETVDEVLVRFQRFQTGRHEPIPIA
jgi:menaquinol-cytochrome c reductase iron-sulfur subunit